MNKKLFFPCLLAIFAMTGCSSDDSTAVKNNEMISDGTPRYLSVNIVSKSAGESKTTTFENGTDAENAIKKIRFYFFTDEGEAAKVKADGTNYYQCDPSDITPGTNGENVEETLSAIIVINTTKGDRIPSQMLAVINPEEAGLTAGSLSLDQIRSTVEDYAALANAANPTFVMANSVYRDNSSECITTSSIASANVCKTENAAKENPVDVYVERSVAKVALQYSSDITFETIDGKQMIALKDKNDKVITVYDNAKGTDKKVYLNVLGWDLTANTGKTYLSKHINVDWSDNLFAGGEIWTSQDYHRSFWATNVMSDSNADDAGIEYSSFTTHSGAPMSIAEANATLKDENWKYTNENAASVLTTGAQRTYPTQAIVLGQIVDENGDPLTISDYLGSKYVEADATCENLRTTIAGVLATEYFSKTTGTNGTVTYTSIGKDDIAIETTSVDAEDELNAQATTGRYKVKVKLSDTGAKKDWFTSNAKDATAITTLDLNTKLAAYTAKVWNTGNTYYAFKINHLATAGTGQYGVVRNHYYLATINKVVGLGTPVYDVSKKIYPEEPENLESYVAAKIHILAWRLVKQDISFGE